MNIKGTIGEKFEKNEVQYVPLFQKNDGRLMKIIITLTGDCVETNHTKGDNVRILGAEVKLNGYDKETKKLLYGMSTLAQSKIVKV